MVALPIDLHTELKVYASQHRLQVRSLVIEAVEELLRARGAKK
jgi:hypothetical protein